MRYLGFADASILPGHGPDGGVDVIAASAVAQVKATVGNVGRPIVQQISGIAQFEGKQALCFSTGGYTDEAIVWAKNAGVALYELDLAGMAEPRKRLGPRSNGSRHRRVAYLG
jgi:hypothetical protein